MSSIKEMADDIFFITVPKKNKPQPKFKTYEVFFVGGGSWEFDRRYLDIVIHRNGEQCGEESCFDTLREALETLPQMECVEKVIYLGMKS